MSDLQSERKHTAAWRVFHFRYGVRIPQMFMYGPKYLEKAGYHISDDPQLDDNRMFETITMRQTAAGLALLHADGAPLDFVDRKDAVPVYRDITEHLKNWEAHIAAGCHPLDIPPLSDFRKLEEVARSLYEEASFFRPGQEFYSPLRERLMDLNRRRNPERTANAERRRGMNDEGELKPFDSIYTRIEGLVMEDPRWQ